MTTKTVTIGGEGGAVVITKSDDGATTIDRAGGPGFEAGMVQGGDGYSAGGNSHRPLDGGSFVAGLLLGALLYFIVQSAMRWHARRETRGLARAAAIGPQAEDRTAADIAALARRTAALETIVTDPAHRTAQAIDALR